MKKLIVFCLFCVFICGFANITQAHQIPTESLPDYLGTIAIPLTKDEARALRMSETYAKHGVEPFMTADGKLVYIHGASLVTVLASPLQVVDIELQSGEQINEVIIGDSARWQIEKGQVANISHLFIKPVSANIETNIVITTNKRVYHLRLISTEKKITPYIGFLYTEEMLAYSADQKLREELLQQVTLKNLMTGVNEETFNLADLNFNYSIHGEAKWTPERVYDNSITTYIEFPPEVRSGMPILLVSNGKNEELVNYRVKDNFMIADGVFENLYLVIGVGGNKEIVTITKENKE